MILPVRFWAKVDRSGGPDACWPWTGSCRETGYGQFVLDGKNWRAHRLVWVEANGPVPSGMFICHSCDNTLCVNLAHLFLGDAASNNKDSRDKGRGAKGATHGLRLHPERAAVGARHGSHTHPEKRPRGERHGMVSLSDAQVANIRALYATGGYKQKQLAREYGVSQGSISHFINKKTRA